MSPPAANPAPIRRVRLLVLNAALGPLDYRVPEGMRVEPGAVVMAPLGPRQIMGVVWEAEHLPADTVPDARLRAAVFGRIAREYADTVALTLEILQQRRLLEDQPALATSIAERFPYLDALNHLQVDLLRRFRAGETGERTLRAIHLTINGLSSGLRNSG